MTRRFPWILNLCRALLAWEGALNALLAQEPGNSDMTPQWKVQNTERLLARLKDAPRLPLEISNMIRQPPSDAGEIGMVSSIAAGSDGLFPSLDYA